MAFGAPLLLDSTPAAGTLREHTTEQGTPVLLYEAGEALRFDETAIRIGVRGVMNVLRATGMLRAISQRALPVQPLRSHGSSWVRAPVSGVLRSYCGLGSAVHEGDLLGRIGDPVGGEDTEVCAGAGGVVIGQTSLPLVYEGEALFHIARVDDPAEAALAVRQSRRMAKSMPGVQRRG